MDKSTKNRPTTTPYTQKSMLKRTNIKDKHVTDRRQTKTVKFTEETKIKPTGTEIPSAQLLNPNSALSPDSFALRGSHSNRNYYNNSGLFRSSKVSDSMLSSSSGRGGRPASSLRKSETKLSQIINMYNSKRSQVSSSYR